MESNDLSLDELRAELKRARALQAICADAGEVDGETAHRSTGRALEKRLRDIGETV